MFPPLSPTVPLGGCYKSKPEINKICERLRMREEKRIFQYIKNFKRSNTKRSKQDKNKVKMNSESKLQVLIYKFNIQVTS